MAGGKAVGVDIGASHVRVALAKESGKLITQQTEKIDTTENTSVSRQTIEMISNLAKGKNIDKEDLKGVGIASTGPMDIERGVLIKPSNIPFDEVPLVEPIKQKLKVPTFLLNDCTAGALGELNYGAGREEDVDNLVYINIGTGIGGGAVVDGNLLLGKDGNAVEVGHFTIDIQERLKCGCGKWGHWEAYCSGKNIPRFVRMRVNEMDEEMVEESKLFKSVGEDLSDLSSEVFYRCVKEGDEIAAKLADEISNLNSVGFGNVIDAYDPSIVTVGGSVALNNREEVLTPLKEKIDGRIRNIKPTVKATPLGEEVGMYGAVAKAFSGGR